MIEEALNAFDRTPRLTASEQDELKTLFLTRLTRMTGLIEAPSSRDFADSFGTISPYWLMLRWSS